jgi:hypothetical protein
LARQKLSLIILILQGKIMRYAPSRFWLLPHLISDTRERYRESGNISLKRSFLLEEKGKAIGSPSVTEKLQQAFRWLVHPDARRFWATFPGHGCEQGVCHKDSSGSCVRGMSNPITPYHKNSSSN